MNISEISPIILTLIAALPGLLALFSQKRKDKRDDNAATIDNAGKVTAQAILLIEPLNKRIIELEEKVKLLETTSESRDKIIQSQNIRLNDNEIEISKLKNGIKKLLAQIIRLGHIPEWNPEPNGE